VALERGDLAGAAVHLREADGLGESAGLPQHPYRWRVALALLREAEGDPGAAANLLDEAERVYVGDFNPNTRPVDAVRARVLATSGDVAAGLAWARGRDLSVDDDLSFLHEYEHVTLARVLLADHAATGASSSLAGASALLHRLLADAEAGSRTGTTLEVLVLQSLAHDLGGRREQALTALTRAVELAEPEGCTRPFTVEGAVLAELLTALGERRPTWSFLGRLRDAAVAVGGGPVAVEGVPTRTPSGPVVPEALVDPLSSRELDVLRYLGSELDGPDIARELGVALSTVRTHTQHIYAKLGVTNRRAAVRRAHQLHLFPRPR
jgi:LuxR family maltose regulon positive regulatory protein